METSAGGGFQSLTLDTFTFGVKGFRNGSLSNQAASGHTTHKCTEKQEACIEIFKFQITTKYFKWLVSCDPANIQITNAQYGKASITWNFGFPELYPSL